MGSHCYYKSTVTSIAVAHVSYYSHQSCRLRGWGQFQVSSLGIQVSLLVNCGQFRLGESFVFSVNSSFSSSQVGLGLEDLKTLAVVIMSHHNRRHGHNCNGSNQSSSSGYGAPTYNYDPLQQAPAAPYGQQMNPVYGQTPSYGGYGQQVMPYQQPSGYGGYPGQDLQHLQAEEHRHRQNEHRAEMGALGAVAFAAYEKHEEKVDPDHAHRHHVEAQVAEAAALGQGGYALYERHEANTIYKQEPDLGGARHRGHNHRH